MRLVLFLLLIRYLLRLIPASMMGGALIMEDLDKHSKPQEPLSYQNERQDDGGASGSSPDPAVPSAIKKVD